MSTVKIVPSILAKNKTEFKKKVARFAPFFKLLQIDIMDGHFVPNKTYYRLSEIKRLPNPVNFELHLMVNQPLRLIKHWIDFDKVRSIIVHFEALKSADELREIKNLLSGKIRLGLAINPKTEIKNITEYLKFCNFVLMMGVTPGFSGQKIDRHLYRRITALNKLKPKIKISVDGGLNVRNINKIIKLGVSELNLASYFDQPVSLTSLIKQLRLTITK